MKLELAAPIATWDEAVPLGNGLLGGLLWGGDATLRLSLDRGDLWDERPAPGDPIGTFTYAEMARLVGQKRNAEISDRFDARGYDQTYPTKIPAGRIEFDLAPGAKIDGFELDLATATGRAKLAGGGAVEGFFNAIEPVAMVRVPLPAWKGLRLLAPGSVKKLGYPAAVPGAAEGAVWFTQAAADGRRFCVCAGTRREGAFEIVAITVVAPQDGGTDVSAAARERVAAALQAGYDAQHDGHMAWWRAFWAISSVTVPDAEVQRHYNLVQYFYGSASRRGAPPMPLQGVWTADDGDLPPWKGDYHHDLNTEMTYMGYQASARFDEGRAYLDLMDGLLPTFRRFARDFYGAPGAAVPAVMTLGGHPMGGWAQYSASPVHGAWIGQIFYLHWRYTRDEKFLREVAYPWCREVGECLRSLLRPDANGVLVLPLSASPEAWNNSARAWLTPNSNYDIACLRMLFLANEEMARELGDTPAAAQWSEAAASLGPLHINSHDVLMLSRDENLTFSHRHFATLMGIYPFNLVTIEGSDRDRAVIHASLAEIDRLGVVEWCGYSYTWMAALRARVGEPEAALWHLKAYLRAFVLRNGFHANGDQTGLGFSSFRYRPVTLEGNFLACAAVHEMLLQSWDPRPGEGRRGPIRVFPATPWRWHDAAFSDLAAEGGRRVSAHRENNATTWLRVVATTGGEVRIRDNFGGRPVTWNRPDAARDGDDFIFNVKAGDVVEGTLPRPGLVPPAPVGACLDDVARPPDHPGIRMYP